jgi:predicted NBD/HSP70 family sugar kinase
VEKFDIFKDMAERTGGSIYVGVVGPVRTGKSTFIKRFMDLMVMPNIQDDYARTRTRDELPQSGSGRTIMTTEPKFVPDEPVELTLGDGVGFRIRLVDCVGYAVEGALGYMDEMGPRMVRTPWREEEMSFQEAAEIGANYLSLGVIDLTGKMRDTVIEKIVPHQRPEAVFERIMHYVTRQQSQPRKARIELVGLGIAVTGLVDTKRGINRFAPNLGWRDINVKEELSRRLSIPVIVDNNVRLMAMGEQWFGKARSSGGLIFVQVGAGVGCGIVLPGVGLLRGAFDGAGELGHCTVLPGGPVCKCGKRGCLEALISERALISAYLQRKAIKSGATEDPRIVSVDTIVESANQGDTEATLVLREAAEFLGIGLATLVNILQPSQIILNGNAFALSPLTRTWIYESTQRHRFSSQENIELSDATFRGLQGMVGAATAALQQEVF